MPLSRAYGIDTALIKGEALVLHHCSSGFAFMEKLFPHPFKQHLALVFWRSNMEELNSKGNEL